jgi:hypothetical protein
LSAPCSRPHPPLGGGGNIKLQVLHLSGNAVAVKGREPCCPIPSAASQLLLASRDAGAHTASRETLWGGYTQPGIAMWLPGWPLKEWCRWFSAMPVHGYSATCANHVRSSQGPLMASQMAGGGSGTDNHTPEAMPRETQKSRPRGHGSGPPVAQDPPNTYSCWYGTRHPLAPAHVLHHCQGCWAHGHRMGSSNPMAQTPPCFSVWAGSPASPATEHRGKAGGAAGTAASVPSLHLQGSQRLSC